MFRLVIVINFLCLLTPITAFAAGGNDSPPQNNQNIQPSNPDPLVTNPQIDQSYSSFGFQNSFYGTTSNQCGVTGYLRAGNRGNFSFQNSDNPLQFETGLTISSNPCNSQKSETKRTTIRENGQTNRSCIAERGKNAAKLIEQGMNAANIKEILDSICTIP